MTVENEIYDEADREERDDSNVVYDITTSGADFDVEGLVKRVDRGDIYRPAFQRNFVWSQSIASRFIESILLGLPIPSVFLYREEETNKLLIVDGLQRLTSLHSFVKGYLPDKDTKFRLTGLKSRFNKLAYSDLHEDDRRRFDDTVIHAFIVQQTTPENDHSAVFHIFDRINSNGVPLQPQEMRAAIYHGTFLEHIEKLNDLHEWREIFGPIHKRSKDSELILRFFALYFNHQNYKSPVNAFLNQFLESNRECQVHGTHELNTLFTETMKRVHDALGSHTFRPNKALNVALFDSFCIGVAKNPTASQSKIRTSYDNLLANEKYLAAINDSTSGAPSVKTRIEIAMTELS